MSEFEKHTNRDYSKFDAMSTEALNEILRQDSQLPDNEESDLDAILYIMEVIAKREKEQPEFEFTDVDTAWNSFKHNYQPTSNDGISLHDFDEELSPTRLHNPEPSSLIKDERSSRHSRHGFLRVACIAAAMVIAVFAGSLTAYALGYDLWSAVATWTKDTFGFETVTTAQPESAPSTKQIPEQLKELEQLLSENGLSNSVLPGYVPDGYISADAQCNILEQTVTISCLLENGQNSILLLYRAYAANNFAFQYEKNEGVPEVYEVNGVTYYLMSNMGTYLASWVAGNVECNISGVGSYDELVRIIDSINGG